jgi:nucleoid-associated protein YgaU
MSIKNSIQLAELQRKSLHAKQPVEAIQKKILQKCVVEANRLFQESASDMEKDDREKLSKQLSFLVKQAENYFREADTLEVEGKLEQAHEKYKKVEDIAIDYPNLPEALKKIDDAIVLVRTLERRAKRRIIKQDKQSPLLPTSSQSGIFRGWLPLLACFSLILIMVVSGLLYTENLTLPFTKKDTLLQDAPLERDDHLKIKDTVSLQLNEKNEQPESQGEEKDKTIALKQQTQKNVLSQEEVGKQLGRQKQAEQIATSEIKKILPPAPKKQIFNSVPALIKGDKQQKLSDHDTKSTRKERAVSFTEPQLNQNESLSPVPVSFLQIGKMIRDSSSAEDGFTIRQDIQPTADIARKSVETIPAKSAPLLQDHVAKTLTVDEPEQPQQIPTVIKQQDESPVVIASSRETSVETFYTVQPGDTLGLISLKEYGASSKWTAIANANKDQFVNNTDGLKVGMTLVIPPFLEIDNFLLSQRSSTSLADLNEDGTYTVQPGDSLGNIAQKLFGNTRKWRKIYELNEDVLTAPHILMVGQVLRVKASGPVKDTIESSQPEPWEKRHSVLAPGADPNDNIDSQ